MPADVRRSRLMSPLVALLGRDWTTPVVWTTRPSTVSPRFVASTACGAAAFLPMSRRGRWALLVLFIVLPLVLLFGPRELSHRFRSMSDPDEAGIKERVYMWRSGVSMWRERPLLGWGPGGVKREYTRYALPEAFKKRTGHVHNTPLQILVERGVLGLATWLAIWIAFYRHAVGVLRALDASRVLVAGSIAAVTGFLVAGLSEYNFGDSEVVMVAWAVMALPWAARAGSGLAAGKIDALAAESGH